MTMTDKFEIRELADLYSNATTRRDADAIARCFAPDAIWDVKGAAQHYLVGNRQIGDGLVLAMAALKFSVQINTAFVIEVEGEIARSQCSIVEHAYLENGNALTLAGVYHDLVVRQEGRWVYQHRRCMLNMHHESPLNGQIILGLPI